MNSDLRLYEKESVWFFRGVPLHVGGCVMIHGMEWKVLGISRSRSESQAPFLWIRNESYGTTVYAPSLSHRLTAA